VDHVKLQDYWLQNTEIDPSNLHLRRMRRRWRKLALLVFLGTASTLIAVAAYHLQ
jgi:hypothetical protein